VGTLPAMVMILAAASVDEPTRHALAADVAPGAYTLLCGGRPDLSGLDGPAVLAISDGVAVGAAVMTPYTTASGALGMELVLLWVAPEFRGRHLARSLLAALVDNTDADAMRATIPAGAALAQARAILVGAGFTARVDGTWSARHVRRTHGRSSLTQAR